MDKIYNLKCYWYKIRQKVKAKEILSHILAYCTSDLESMVINPANGLSFMQKMDLVRKKLKVEKEPGFGHFCHALRKTGNDFALKFISGDVDLEIEQFYLDLISENLSILIKKFDPTHLFPYLQYSATSSSDEEQITTEMRSIGTENACQSFLTQYIHCKTDDWLPILIVAFNKSGHNHVSRIIDESLSSIMNVPECRTKLKQLFVNKRPTGKSLGGSIKGYHSLPPQRSILDSDTGSEYSSTASGGARRRKSQRKHCTVCKKRAEDGVKLTACPSCPGHPDYDAKCVCDRCKVCKDCNGEGTGKSLEGVSIKGHHSLPTQLSILDSETGSVYSSTASGGGRRRKSQRKHCTVCKKRVEDGVKLTACPSCPGHPDYDAKCVCNQCKVCKSCKK